MNKQEAYEFWFEKFKDCEESLTNQERFNKLFEEGENSFIPPEINPHCPYFGDYHTISFYSDPWRYGFDCAKDKYFQAKYPILKIKEQILQILKENNLSLYGEHPYVVYLGTPEGYDITIN